MARLVSVCRSADHAYSKRQMPLQVEDNLTMVLQFTDMCLGCDTVNVKKGDIDNFSNRFNLLTCDDISMALMATQRELFEHLAATAVPCVGCRKSMERLYEQLMESGHATLDPLLVSETGVLSVCRSYLFSTQAAYAQAAYALFYVHGGKLSEVLGTLPKNKKNRRCQLHSLDMQKCKFTGNWYDVWELMSTDCKEELLLVDFETLTDALDDYLIKHRFCSECKTKVQRAYTLLTGDGEAAASAKKEKGYCAALYEGFRLCRQEKHLHVNCSADLVERLIMRAEPDLIGSRRERHAKTMDVAQEEVLACLGSLLHERFGRVHQKLRLAEQTWRQLFYVGVDCLKKNFEVAVEKKQGVSNLERLCEEMALADKLKEQKRELKRQKKKDKKKAATKRSTSASGGEAGDSATGSGSASTATCGGITAESSARSPLIMMASKACQTDDDDDECDENESCASCSSEPRYVTPQTSSAAATAAAGAAAAVAAAPAAPISAESAVSIRRCCDAAAAAKASSVLLSVAGPCVTSVDQQGRALVQASPAVSASCSESCSLSSESSCCGEVWPTAEDEPQQQRRRSSAPRSAAAAPVTASLASGAGSSARRGGGAPTGTHCCGSVGGAGRAHSSTGCGGATSAKTSLASDPGYSSGADGSGDSCACSEPACCGDDESCPAWDEHRLASRSNVCYEHRSRVLPRFRGPSLLDMLESPLASDGRLADGCEADEAACDSIPDDEVAAFRALQPDVVAQRLKLRRTLRIRFEQLVRQQLRSGSAPPVAAVPTTIASAGRKKMPTAAAAAAGIGAHRGLKS